jgi:hypothetical protein
LVPEYGVESLFSGVQAHVGTSRNEFERPVTELIQGWVLNMT